jgi:hypothetical protein
MFGHSSRAYLMGVAIVFAATSTRTAAAQCELQAIEGTSAYFGRSVAIDGDLAIVASTGGPMVYRFDEKTLTWIAEAQLVGEGVVPGDLFGESIDIDGDTAIASAPGDDTLAPNAGAVYVFRRNAENRTWNQEQKLAVLLPEGDLAYGSVVKIDGDVIAMRKMGTAAFVFRRDQLSSVWAKEAVLTPSIGDAFDRMGLAVSGEAILMGTEGIVGNNCYGGECKYYEYVDVFTHSEQGWDLQNTLFGTYPGFGVAIDLGGDTAAIGSIAVNDSELTPAVEIWGQQSKLWQPQADFEGDGDNNFYWVTNWTATDGDTVVLGDAFDVNNGARGSAAVSTYDPTSQTWQEFPKLLASNGVGANTFFGVSVGVSDGKIIVGAPAVSSYQQPSPGWVYFFDLNQADCNQNALCDIRDIAEGTSADENANGIPDECEAMLGDANGDGAVNVDDLLLVINSWGTCPVRCAADMTGDGVVDQGDLEVVLFNWTDQT